MNSTNPGYPAIHQASPLENIPEGCVDLLDPGFLRPHTAFLYHTKPPRGGHLWEVRPLSAKKRQNSHPQEILYLEKDDLPELFFLGLEILRVVLVATLGQAKCHFRKQVNILMKCIRSSTAQKDLTQ